MEAFRGENKYTKTENGDHTDDKTAKKKFWLDQGRLFVIIYD